VSVISCSRDGRTLATSAVATDFSGKWTGRWSWEPSKLSSVEVSGTNVTIVNLPVTDNKGAQINILSGQGSADFEASYGAEGKPCILVSLPRGNEAVAFFITADLKHLDYTVDINYDRRIVFSK
jgi:hypothetical protein